MLQQNWFCSEWPDTNISSHSKLSNFDKNVKPSVFHAHFLKTPLLSQVIMSWAEWSKQFHHNYYHVWLLRYAHSSCLYLANIFHDFKWTYLNNWTWYNRTDYIIYYCSELNGTFCQYQILSAYLELSETTPFVCTWQNDPFSFWSMCMWCTSCVLLVPRRWWCYWDMFTLKSWKILARYKQDECAYHSNHTW